MATRAKLRLAEVARSKEISIRELGRLSNVSYRIVQAAWHNKGNPTIETLTRFAEALEVDVVDLFEAGETVET